MSTSPEKPHDRLFKAVFSQPAHALAELKAVLPPTLFAAIDPTSLAEVPPGFVDAALKETQKDVILRATVRGHRATVYFPFEHRSTGQRLLPLRVLRYSERVWEAELRRSPRAKRLPGVVPVVVHQGPRPFRGPRSIRATLEGPDWLLAAFGENVPALSLLIDDLGATPAEAIAARPAPPLVRLALLVLKAARHRTRALEILEKTGGVVRELVAEPGGLANLDMLLRYVYLVTTGVSRAELRRRLARIYPPEAKNTVMTIGEQLIAEGRAKGKAEGKAEGMRQMLKLALAARFGRLPTAVTARIERARDTTLERWAARIGTAADLASVLKAPREKPAAKRRPSARSRPRS